MKGLNLLPGKLKVKRDPRDFGFREEDIGETDGQASRQE